MGSLRRKKVLCVIHIQQAFTPLLFTRERFTSIPYFKINRNQLNVGCKQFRRSDLSITRSFYILCTKNILPVLVHGWESWCDLLRRNTNWGWRRTKLQNEKLHNLYASPNIINYKVVQFIDLYIGVDRRIKLK